MDEKEFFNRDSMFWREVNATSTNMYAEIELIEATEIEGLTVDRIQCILLPFEAADVIHEMADGSAFKKNEVIAWPYIPLDDIEFYKNESNAEAERNMKVQKIEHTKIQAIILKDDKGTVVLRKAKV